MAAIVSVDNLSKQYGDFTAVKNLSFIVNEGDVYGFLGQNGAGKSTTIRMLLTLIKPTAGSIKIFDKELHHHRSEILKKTGAIIERPDLYKYLSAYNNLSIFAKMSGIKVTRKLLMDQLQMVGLDKVADKKAALFSQGMKQRLGIAVALVHNPKLIILDEPTNGLDPQGIADMRNLILRLSKEMGKTVVISSHLLSEVEQIANRMIIIHKGEKVVEGNVDELLDPEHTVVEIETTNNVAAKQLLLSTKWNEYLQADKPLQLMMNKEMVPALVKELVTNDVQVLSVNASHSLENYFYHLQPNPSMWRLLQIELFKISKRPRTYIAFAAITAIVFIFQFAFKSDGQSYMDLMLQDVKDTFTFDRVESINGYFMCYIILNTLLIQVPILIALIAADSISGEANMGTLRLLISKPISRTQIILVKFAAATIFTVLLLLWMAVSALLLSLLIFGTGDMLVFRTKGTESMIMLITKDDVMWRYYAAFAYATVALTVIAALSLLLSIFAENSIGPIIATVCIVIVCTIISNINVPIIERNVKPYLFTSYLVGWKGFFYIGTDETGKTIKGSLENWPAIRKSLLILFAHIAVIVTTAVIVFRRKDILS